MKRLVQWKLPPLGEENLLDFFQFVDPESVFEDFSLQHYVECRQLLQTML